MTIATRCRRCGREFEADRWIILAGSWPLCPACRDAPPGELAAGSPVPLPA